MASIPSSDRVTYLYKAFNVTINGIIDGIFTPEFLKEKFGVEKDPQSLVKLKEHIRTEAVHEFITICENYDVSNELSNLERLINAPIHSSSFNADQYAMDVEQFVRTRVVDRVSKEQGQYLENELSRMEKEKQRLLRKLSEKQHEYDAAASRYESAANSVRTRLAHAQQALSQWERSAPNQWLEGEANNQM